MTWVRKMLLGALAVGLVAVATTALVVASTTDRLSDEPLPTSGVLDGRNLVASEVVGRKLLAGTELVLWFQDGKFAVTSGCNDTRGGYLVRADRLRTIQASQTAMGCFGGREAQDAWVNDLIDGAEVAQRGNRLSLRSGNTTITFIDRLDRDRPDAIVGQRWRLVRFTDDGGRPRGLGYRPRPNRHPELMLSDGIGHILTPCVGSSPDVRHEPGAVVFGPIERSWRRLKRASCSGARARVDTAMRTGLRGRVSVVRRGDRLTVSGGATKLRFERVH